MITKLTKLWLVSATVALIGFLARPATPGGSIENGTTDPQSAPQTLGKLVEGNRIVVFAPIPISGALTEDERRLCVVLNIISRDDLRGGLALFDLEENRQLDQITFPEVGFTGQTAAATHDGVSRCYVAVSSAQGGVGNDPGPNRIEVVRLDEDNLVVEESIPTPEICTSAFGPIGMAASPDGSRIYVGDRGCQRVHIIDADPTSPDFNTIIGSVRTFGAVIEVDVTPDGSRVYAANRSPDGTLACIDAALADTDPDNALGGPACDSVQQIPLTIGVSGAGAAVAISPDGRRAYAAFNLADACVPVVDIDPASKTYNQQIEALPSTGLTLAKVGVSRDGRRLFVASHSSGEVIIYDTETLAQVQRLTIVPVVNQFVVPRREDIETYVVSSGRRILRLKEGRGPFLPPGDDTKHSDAMGDFNEPTDCPVPSVQDEPDPGIDPPIRIERDGNRILAYRAGEFDAFQEFLLLNPHPLNGAPQDVLINYTDPVPLASPEGGLPKQALQLFSRTLGEVLLESSHLRIDEYDSSLRPISAAITSEFLGAEPSKSSIRGDDADENGLTETVTLNLSLLPDVELDVDLFGDGNVSQYYGLSGPGPLGQREVNFTPLADTNGDGLPDSPAFDIDGDGEADPDLPLFPFFAGAENPEVELKIHFAQFGDGTVGEATLSSQITLFNLDPDVPAQVKILLRGDDGNLLTVDLNGEDIAGEKEVVIPAGGMVQLSTDGEGPLVAGSVIVCSDRAVAGVILFRGNVGVAGVGVSHVMAHGFVAPMETSIQAGVNTGIAVTNLRDTEFTVPLVLCDVEGKRLATGQLVLAGSGHRSLFVDEIEWVLEEGIELDLTSFTGILKAEDGKLAATVIQTRPEEFATRPVAPNFGQLRFGQFTLDEPSVAPAGKAEPELNQKLYFAQFGNGGEPGAEVFSQILLLNLTDQEANVKVLLKNDNGEPLSVTLNEEVVEGEKNLVIPAGGLAILQSDGKGDLISPMVKGI